MIILDCEQGSAEWHNARLAIPTASNFGKILTAAGKVSESAGGYAKELAEEYITGIPADTFVSYDMKRGIELEPDARDVFEMKRQVEVLRPGLCYQDEQKKWSCSPDGLILPLSLRKGLEIKCPKFWTHVEYVKRGVLPTTYIPQVQGSLFITGFEVWYFMSYHPARKSMIIEVERDEKYISRLSEELDRFVYGLASVIKELKEMA